MTPRFTFLLTLVACPGPADTDTPVDSDGDGVVDTQDCAPGDPTIHPGAAEVCDGVDQDCDGDIDEDAIDQSTWFADEDEDGHGDPEVYEVACEVPGAVAVGDDCDDSNAAVHPGAEEVCGDGVDNDCVDGAPRCPLAGAIPFTQATRFFPTTGYTCALTGLDFDGDGRGDVGCSSQTALFGPLEQTPAEQSWRPDRLVEDRFTGAGRRPMDVNGDGVGDALSIRADEGEVGLYLGPFDSVRADRGDRVWTMPEGSEVRADNEATFGLFVRDPDGLQTRWMRGLPADGEDLAKVSDWSVRAEILQATSFADVSGDEHPDVLVTLDGSGEGPSGVALLPGAPGTLTLEDALWFIESTPERSVVAYATEGEIAVLIGEGRRTEVRLVNPTTGELSSALLVMEPPYEEGDPQAGGLGLSHINGDEHLDLAVHSAGNQLLVWWGPVVPPLDPTAPDLRVYAPVSTDVQLGEPRVLDADDDGLPDLAFPFFDQDLARNGTAVIWGDRL